MSNFFGKLFSGSAPPRSSDGVLRAYGKVPYYAEYRRLELSPGTPAAFSRWLDEGRLAWVRAMPAGKHGETRASRVLLRPPGNGKEWVVASIWDSRDNVGRVFPFSFFVVAPPEALGDDPAQRWASACGLFEQFERCYTEVAGLASGGDFYKKFQKREMVLKPGDVAARAAGLRQQAFAIKAPEWFDGTGTQTSFDDWFANVRRRVARWRAEPAGNAQLAIACPLTAGVPTAAQAVLWLDWLAAVSRSLGREPSVFISAGEPKPPASMYVLFREPMPGDFQLLTTDSAAYGYVEDLAARPAGVESSGASSADLPMGLMADWLKRHAPN